MGTFNIGSLQDIIEHKGLPNFHKKQRTVWQAVCWVMLYMIWNARNKRVFENRASNMSTICDEVQILSFHWISHRAKETISSWIEWCSDPIKACKL